LLADYQALILAEPNNPYQDVETKAIVAFVKNGGGAFLVGDHGGADRDNDGWDAVKALNVFCPEFGFTFAGDFLYEAPVTGGMNSGHPVLFGVRAIGAWAGSTFILQAKPDAKSVGLIDSRFKKAPYLVASEVGKGRVVAIGDSSPFDDGVGSGGKDKLHDSYDSFMYSHPQLAYNAMMWVTGQEPAKRVPSKVVAFANEAKAEDKAKNILVDAAHGNAASDKMETFERHMKKLGFKVFYTLNLLTPDMLQRFGLVILPNPSLPITAAEMTAVADWFMAGGRLIVAGDWDSTKLDGRRTHNELLTKLGSVIRLNSDQVWDNTNKTNKPWGVLSHILKAGHPAMKGIKTIITWGTCSLITRDKQPLTEAAGVVALVTGDDDTLNKDGDKKNDAVIYPKGMPIVNTALERLANGILVVNGCNNFTDYQYPDSDINQAQAGPCPFVHETGEYYDNLVSFLLAPAEPGAARAPRRGH
jgi:uncharacterized membrane protein